MLSKTPTPASQRYKAQLFLLAVIGITALLTMFLAQHAPPKFVVINLVAAYAGVLVIEAARKGIARKMGANPRVERMLDFLWIALLVIQFFWVGSYIVPVGR
jgi:hypothetical protein